MFDAIVIGGGIVGMAAAYNLVRGGAQTLLIERGEAGQATAAGAGILSPASSGHESEDWFNFAVTAVDYYPVLLGQLAADEAGETGYAPLQQLIVAVSPDEDIAFAATKSRVLARQKRVGLPRLEELSPIDAPAARLLFPPLAAIRDGLLYRSAARVDGRLLAGALRRGALRHGLTVKQANVERLVIKEGAVTGVISDGETINGGAVIIAGGAWSGEFAEQLAVKAPVSPQRGQIIHLSLNGVDTSAWPVIIAFHGHYLVPWADSRVAVGATRETVGYAPRTTAAGVHEVLSEALRVAPGLADASIADIRVGLRPGTPDNLPILGAVPGVRNVYFATGHGASGLQLGPFSGKVVANLVLTGAAGADIEAFSVTRFG
jgi:glycine/D-amino acid oxidase-like deaminating enzyme